MTRIITHSEKSTALRVAWLFLFSTFVLSWLSPDSFLMHEWGSRGDSSWFFTCGKAWMEGLTPYVDFTDSKGPVLWLVYGLAYLLTPTSYSGVLWMSVVALTVTLEFVWRTSRLFAGHRTSLVAVVIMSVLVLLRPVHNETKAEDFCLPWISIGLYYTCLVLQPASRVHLRRAAFWMGVGMAWCLLVKWNVFFMMGGMALVVVVKSFAHKRADAVLMGLLGMAVVCVCLWPCGLPWPATSPPSCRNISSIPSSSPTMEMTWVHGAVHWQVSLPMPTWRFARC